MPDSTFRSPVVLASLVVPSVVALALLVVGARESGIDPTLAQTALLAAGIAILASVAVITRLYLVLGARLGEVAGDLARIRAGGHHRFVAASQHDPLGPMVSEINQLVGGMRKAQIAAERERALERAMVRETPNGLVVISKDGVIQRHNPSFASLLPIEGDPVGRLPIEVVPVVEFQEVVDETLRTRQPSERTAAVGRREALFRAVPLADGEGCLGVVLDITSVRQAERGRREFVANVSHELRTPVTAVVGYSESLLQDKAELPGWAVPMVEAIERNARRLGALIEDVLHLSRLEARQGDFVLVEEPLRPIVEEVLGRFVGTVQQKGLHVALVDGADVVARVNLEAFEHALANLVDNAAKYTPAGGHLDVRIEEGADAVIVSVTDDGPGIDPIHHERIFERFYRVDPGRSRDVGGTGLGLALVKHLCMAMHAEVTVDSELGKGCRFLLKLPRRNSPSEG